MDGDIPFNFVGDGRDLLNRFDRRDAEGELRFYRIAIAPSRRRRKDENRTGDPNSPDRQSLFNRSNPVSPRRLALKRRNGLQDPDSIGVSLHER
jgi:hypothetical protein